MEKSEQEELRKLLNRTVIKLDDSMRLLDLYSDLYKEVKKRYNITADQSLDADNYLLEIADMPWWKRIFIREDILSFVRASIKKHKESIKFEEEMLDKYSDILESYESYESQS